MVARERALMVALVTWGISSIGCSEPASPVTDADIEADGDGMSADADVILSDADVSLADGDTARPEPIEVPCQPSQPAPYPEGVPYVGIHANREGNDTIACDSASAFVTMWHALPGLGLVQPNTFSPDGAITYATSTNADPDGCRLHALDTVDGSVEWCRSYPQSIAWSAVEVDFEGFLYFGAGVSIYSLAPEGTDRWSTPLDSGSGGDVDEFGTRGIRFTPDGLIATVTNAGVVHLLDRETGAMKASLDIPATWGFVAPAAFDIDLMELLPEAVGADIEAVLGPYEGGFFGPFFGGGGGFSDNTISVSSRNELYVIGGGLDEDNGALVQIRVEGTPEEPLLEPGWSVPTNAGSATSPSITSDGRYVSIGDGSSLLGMLQPEVVHPSMMVIDVDACDANTDADTDAAVCAPFHRIEMERGPMAGSPALADDGTIYLWETSLAMSRWGADAIDVRAEGLTGQIWSRALEGDLTWTSVMTVTENHVIGTASRVTVSRENVLGFELPSTVESSLALIDRATGDLVFTSPVTDDSAATVTIGPDGSLYVAMLGLSTILAVDQRPVLGLIRFAPVMP